jgi:SPP1 family predicted phage head-tail adaptor
MRIGNFDRQLTILRDVEIGRDELSQPIYEPVPIATVWAEKIHKTEDERFAAEQRYAVRTVTFRTYWIEGILPTDRLRCDGYLYDIKGVRELGFRDGMEIAAEGEV